MSVKDNLFAWIFKCPFLSHFGEETSRGSMAEGSIGRIFIRRRHANV
ncbi:unnamed protein product [Acanthoscelides obtectus]|uniref:Uncharacterized protein n=1 Tax=Acanthoscelides obtectus TaxID=200917 RepID=A0A9P0NXF4_ACAOB|nr:unnamed protein product [Acanthoscelides obtectus]CAK1627900.1 hypothetical protein AOBTE_LOCUS4892 [Acanthoscelides obtectus]